MMHIVCVMSYVCYTDPMGPVLVCISTVEPQLYRSYGTCTSLYKYSGISVIYRPYGILRFHCTYTD